MDAEGFLNWKGWPNPDCNFEKDMIAALEEYAAFKKEAPADLGREGARRKMMSECERCGEPTKSFMLVPKAMCPECAEMMGYTVTSPTSALSEAAHPVLGEVPQCEEERYQFGTILFQRLKKDMIWYAVKAGQIIDWDVYRHDLEERLRHFA